MNERGLERLRFAIVRQAAQDYLEALRIVHRHNPKSDYCRKAGYVIEECERFFKHDCGAFVDVDGIELMNIVWRNSWDDHYRIKG